jgi:hypothetical protein
MFLYSLDVVCDVVAFRMTRLVFGKMRRTVILRPAGEYRRRIGRKVVGILHYVQDDTFNFRDNENYCHSEVRRGIPTAYAEEGSRDPSLRSG